MLDMRLKWDCKYERLMNTVQFMNIVQHRLAFIIMHKWLAGCREGQYYHCNEAGFPQADQGLRCCSGQGGINDIMVLACTSL